MKQYKRRALPLRKGDEVAIMRGKYAGKAGKIADLDLKYYKAYIEGITRKRTVGTDVQVPIHPSNLKITNLNLDDKFRGKILQRKAGIKVEVKKTEVSGKNAETQKTVSTAVLESAKEGKEMDSKS